jgi:3-phytase
MPKKTNIIILLGITTSLLIACSCNRSGEGSKKASLFITKVTQADAETDALKNRSVDDDAADDPAIWINLNCPEQSKIIGTDKKGGLAVYDLDGNELFYYSDGLMNNVDIRQNITNGEDSIDLLACSNRSSNTLNFYSINKDGSLQQFKNAIHVEMEDEVYGFCLSQNEDKLYAFVNSIYGNIEQWEIEIEGEHISGKLVRQLKLTSKTEGMVSDDEAGILFIGEEAKGIWKMKIDPNLPEGFELLSQSTVEKNKNIYEDIEGLCIYKQANGNGYLIASSQGNYSYAVFERKAPHNYLGNFRIGDGVIDGAEETDGIEVVNLNLGEKFPHGMFVAQDGFNKKGAESVAQNFKMVRWEKIANLFEPKLSTNNQCIAINK